MHCVANPAIPLTVLAALVHGTRADEMVFPGKQWETATPESQQVDSEILKKAVSYLARSAGSDGVKRMVVVRNGRMIFKGPEADRRQPVWSVTKAFTSTAHGLLIEEGKCTLDTPAADYNPEHLAELYGGVTLRHLATMTSGYDGLGGSYDADEKGRSDQNALVGPLPPVFAPGTKYMYWDEATQQYGYVLTQIAGESLEDYLKRRVLDPIGISQFAWRRDSTGKVLNWTGGIEISAADLARFGHLFLNQGNWNGKQLIDAAWVREATRVQVPASIPDAHPTSSRKGSGVYGYHWWPNGVRPDGRRRWPHAPVSAFSRSGYNNNDLLVIPPWNMVIVRLGLDEGEDEITTAEYDIFLKMIGQSLLDLAIDSGRSALPFLSTAAAASEPAFPPKLPGGEAVVTDTTDAFLSRPAGLDPNVDVAKTPPKIDFLYYPGQDYPGRPWSVWGDGLAVGGKYYSSIGDHLAPHGNAFVFEYDPRSKKLRTLVDVQRVLHLPQDHYTPGKIHSRIDLGSDGWLYFGTHRGSTRVTTDEYHYRGDWILRHHPGRAKTEIVAHGPVPNHCIPTSLLDPDRLIFYGGTAAGNRVDPVMFFAYDVRKRQVLHTKPNGPYRYLIFARSTGRVYYVNEDGGPLMRFDPTSGEPPVQVPGSLGLRSATQETTDGYVYTVSTRGDGTIWRFNTETEESQRLGNARVGTQDYVTSLDVDPTGRYLYYVPGAHGGSQRDGTPVVQFDVKTRRKKIVAFLHPFYKQQYGYTPLGTFGSAVDRSGETLYITFNGNRGGPDSRGRLPFDTCALVVVHVPESERRP